MSFDLAFTRHDLGGDLAIYSTSIPPELRMGRDEFESLWSLHPEAHPTYTRGNEQFDSRRWHKAFGHDYAFSGFVERSEPVPAILAPYLAWTRNSIDPRINGILVNWYDAVGEHRIPPHKDNPDRRIPGCPIVTISLGASRAFRMHVRRKIHPIVVSDGSVIIIPDETNAKHAHSVPHLPEDRGRRISITLRGFVDDPREA